MARPHVAEVSTNLKAQAEVKLGPKTIIIGPSGTGKSTIVNAIEVAGTGRASDVAGRSTLALDAELWTLAPPGAVAAFARVTLSDETRAEWLLTEGKAAKRAGPQIAFPLRDVHDNLVGSAEKARKWLLGKIAATLPWESALAMIPEPLHARAITLAGGTVLGLPAALDAASRSGRDAKKRAAALRASATDAAAGAPPPPTAEAIEAAKKATPNPHAAALDAALKSSAQASEDAKAARGRLDAALRRRDALPHADATVGQIGAALVTVIKGQIAAKATKCGACGGPADPAAMATRLAAIEKVIVGSQTAIADRAKADVEVATAKERLQDAERQIAFWTTEAARLQKIAAEVVAVEPPEIAALRGRWEQIRAQEAEALAAEGEAEAWGKLADVLSTAVTRVVSSARTAFEERVTAFLPAGLRFGLDLMDGDREVTRYGIRLPDGSLRSALSGAQWAVVTAALAAATAPPEGPVVIVPEDRPIDRLTLTGVLVAFGKIDAQVIVTTPIEPVEVPAGWTVVRVAGASPVEVPAEMLAGKPPAKPRRGRPKKNPEPPLQAPPGEPPAATPGAIDDFFA